MSVTSVLFQNTAKKVIAAGCTAALLCTALCCFTPVAQNAYAEGDDSISTYANTKDLKFKFVFKNSGDTYQGDEPRRKTDATPVYVGVQTMKCDYCHAYIDGSYSSSGPWTNLTVKGLATIKGTGDFCIKSTVHESGATWARITGWAESHSGNVSGLWSPDSLKNYKAINGYQGIE